MSLKREDANAWREFVPLLTIPHIVLKAVLYVIGAIAYVPGFFLTWVAYVGLCRNDKGSYETFVEWIVRVTRGYKLDEFEAFDVKGVAKKGSGKSSDSSERSEVESDIKNMSKAERKAYFRKRQKEKGLADRDPSKDGQTCGKYSVKPPEDGSHAIKHGGGKGGDGWEDQF